MWYNSRKRLLYRLPWHNSLPPDGGTANDAIMPQDHCLCGIAAASGYYTDSCGTIRSRLTAEPRMMPIMPQDHCLCGIAAASGYYTDSCGTIRSRLAAEPRMMPLCHKRPSYFDFSRFFRPTRGGRKTQRMIPLRVRFMVSCVDGKGGRA